MSQVTSENTGKTYTPVSATEGAQQGNLIIVRPSELAKNGTTGVVAEGIYEGSMPNKFDETKLDYKIRAENGDLYILNSSGSLASQLAKVTEGSLVLVEYSGKNEIKKGPRKGTSAHSFRVSVA